MKKLMIVLLLFAYNFANAQNIEFENKYDDDKIAIPIIKIKVGKNIDKLFIVDTGATFSSINIENIYDNYKISYIKNDFNVATFGGVNKEDNIKVVHTFINDSIQINLIGIDLSIISKKLNIDVYGIIGSDFLRKNKLIIDYNKRTIYKSKN